MTILSESKFQGISLSRRYRYALPPAIYRAILRIAGLYEIKNFGILNPRIIRNGSCCLMRVRECDAVRLVRVVQWRCFFRSP